MIISILVWLIDTASTLYSLVLIMRSFLPMVGADPYNPIMQFIYRITEPVLAPLRQWTVRGNYDFSPLVALIIIMIARQIIISFLYTVAF